LPSLSTIEPRGLTAEEQEAYEREAWQDYAAANAGVPRLGPAAVPYDPESPPAWFTPEMGAALRRLLSQDPPAPPTLENIGGELIRRDPSYAPGLERRFLSAVLAGGEIPAGVTGRAFLVPRHKAIFNAILQLRGLGIEPESYASILPKMFPGLEGCIKEIEGELPWPSAALGLALALTRLALGRGAS